MDVGTFILILIFGLLLYHVIERILDLVEYKIKKCSIYGRAKNQEIEHAKEYF